jgi:hypothetical protein
MNVKTGKKIMAADAETSCVPESISHIANG